MEDFRSSVWKVRQSNTVPSPSPPFCPPHSPPKPRRHPFYFWACPCSCEERKTSVRQLGRCGRATQSASPPPSLTRSIQCAPSPFTPLTPNAALPPLRPHWLTRTPRPLCPAPLPSSPLHPERRHPEPISLRPLRRPSLSPRRTHTITSGFQATPTRCSYPNLSAPICPPGRPHFLPAPVAYAHAQAAALATSRMQSPTAWPSPRAAGWHLWCSRRSGASFF
jgi:hypothetical protein